MSGPNHIQCKVAYTPITMSYILSMSTLVIVVLEARSI